MGIHKIRVATRIREFQLEPEMLEKRSIDLPERKKMYTNYLQANN